MEHISQSSLGFDLCRGLHDGGSLDKERARHVLCSRRDTLEDATCAHRWNHAELECSVVCRSLTDCEAGFLKAASHRPALRFLAGVYTIAGWRPLQATGPLAASPRLDFGVVRVFDQSCIVDELIMIV
jgi:hypothetical protein